MEEVEEVAEAKGDVVERNGWISWDESDNENGENLEQVWSTYAVV